MKTERPSKKESPGAKETGKQPDTPGVLQAVPLSGMLETAEKAGIKTVLSSRDKEGYSGNVVNNFRETDSLLKNSALAEDPGM